MANVTRTARKAALKTWLELITASTLGAGDGLAIYWQGVPRGYQLDPHAVVTLPQDITLGTDELLTDEDLAEPAGAEMKQFQVGQRQVTLSVQIWSFQASGDNDATVFASRIRNRIRFRDWKSYFSTAEMAFARFVLDTSITNPVDERDHTARQIDILFNSLSSDEAAAVGYVGTLEDAELQSPEGTTRWTGDITVG